MEAAVGQEDERMKTQEILKCDRRKPWGVWGLGYQPLVLSLLWAAWPRDPQVT